ncbi:MAG: iron-sulfur cluster assembly accessory protein [Legionellales bacterium]|nr:iron-sulfur cluster assembly accessory protein [Legionellales bacterium]
MTTVSQYDPKNIHPQEAITATPAAIQHLQQQIAKKGEGIGIRLATKRSGCNGYSYVIDIINAVAEDDKQFHLDNLVVAISPLDWPLLKGTKLDYIRDGLNFRFVYENPNQSGACGCGESFNI